VADKLYRDYGCDPSKDGYYSSRKEGPGNCRAFEVEILDPDLNCPKPSGKYAFPQIGWTGFFSDKEKSWLAELSEDGVEVALENFSGEKREGRIWCIYVGKSHLENFRIGLKAGTWGFPFQPDASDFEQGDRVLFFHHCSSEQRPVPPGFPRVGGPEDFTGVAKYAVEAQVSKSLYQTQEHLWPDDVFPFRFDFEQIGEIQDLRFPGDLFGEDLMEKMRCSACTPHSTFSLSDDGRMLLTKREGEKASEGYTQGSGLPLSAEDKEFIEGKPQLVTHLKKERASGASREKRTTFKREHGKLFCEHCELDPVEEYGGELGESCIEIHHTIPVAEMEPDHRTTMEELLCLCANCHRVEHRRLRENS